jgi:hypothetical protein
MKKDHYQSSLGIQHQLNGTKGQSDTLEIRAMQQRLCTKLGPETSFMNCMIPSTGPYDPSRPKNFLSFEIHTRSGRRTSKRNVRGNDPELEGSPSRW